jgi:hypothetical protein
MTKTLLSFLVGGAAALALASFLENRSASAAVVQSAWCQPPVDYPLKVRDKKAIERSQPLEMAWCQPPVDYPLKVRDKKAVETRDRTLA